MQKLCVLLIFTGALILAYSLIKYISFLRSIKLIAHEKAIFSQKIYGLGFILILFFLVGYIIMGIFFCKEKNIQFYNYLLSSIFFFGAIFVLVMVTVTEKMSKTIAGKTVEIVQALVKTIEAKDEYTCGHSEHVSNIVKLFYKKLPKSMQLNIDYIQLVHAAVLHDIGKIGIRDNVLNKPGKLTEQEMEIIKQHPNLGKNILSQTSFSSLCEIIYCHHERVDGNGYNSIPSKDIPLESKIISIADTFSALYSDRCYRPKKDFSTAMKIIEENAGSQFDKELVDIFITINQTELDKATPKPLSVVDSTQSLLKEIYY